MEITDEVVRQDLAHAQRSRSDLVDQSRTDPILEGLLDVIERGLKHGLAEHPQA